MTPSRNLILVHTEGWQDVADFMKIKAHVEEMAPDIEVFIASNLARSSIVRKKAATRPTLVFSPVRLLTFRPDRGKLYIGQPMPKLAEMQRLVAGGIPVPPFEEIGPETVLSPEIYGRYVIVKPGYELASWGAGVELVRIEDVRYRAQSDYPKGHPGGQGPMIAQKFIDCGQAMTCRILTLFGAPIFSYWRQSTKPLALEEHQGPFEPRHFMPSPPDSVSFVTHDPVMLAFAAAVYQAVPDVALQACDILRDKNGDLFLLEINPGGGTWMLSSFAAPGYRERLGLADLASEFDAFRTSARVLVEHTRAEAE